MMINTKARPKPKPKPTRLYEARLTLPELHAITRIRQLFKAGADIVIIERRKNQPRIRTVGKIEGPDLK